MNLVLLLLLSAALVSIQCFLGGTRLIYGLLPYAFLGAAAAASLKAVRKPMVKPACACLVSALLLGGYVIGRAAFSPHPYLARPDAFLAAAALSIYFVTAIYLPQARFRTLLAFALFGTAVGHVLVGAIQFTEGNGFMILGFTRPGIYASRASGMLANPNHLAGFLEAVGLIALSYTIWGRFKTSTKMLIAYLALICVIGVALSGSRGGYLSLTAGLIVFALLSIRTVRIYNEARFSITFLGAAAGLIALVGTSVALMKLSPSLQERLHQIDEVSWNVRWYNWQSAMDQYRLSPLIGTGAGTHLTYGRLFRKAPIQGDPRHAHSDYLEFIAEYGAVGGILAAAFLLIHLQVGLKNAREIALSRLINSFGPPRTNSMALMIGALSATVALLAHSVVDSGLHTPGNALLAAFLFGILSNAGIHQQSQSKPEAVDTGLRLAVGAIGIGLLAAIVHWLPAERVSNQVRRAFNARQYAACARLAPRAIASDPVNPNNYYYQGEALRLLAADLPEAERAASLDQAIAAFREGLKQYPQSENLWVRLGQALDATQRWREAGEAYDRAVANDPNLGVIYAYYAEHLRLIGDFDGAKKCADTATALAGPRRKKTDLGDPPPILNVGLPAIPAAP